MREAQSVRSPTEESIRPALSLAVRADCRMPPTSPCKMRRVAYMAAASTGDARLILPEWPIASGYCTHQP